MNFKRGFLNSSRGQRSIAKRDSAPNTDLVPTTQVEHIVPDEAPDPPLPEIAVEAPDPPLAEIIHTVKDQHGESVELPPMVADLYSAFGGLQDLTVTSYSPEEANSIVSDIPNKKKSDNLPAQFTKMSFADADSDELAIPEFARASLKGNLPLPEVDYVYATIPARKAVPTKTELREGWCEALLDPATERKILEMQAAQPLRRIPRNTHPVYRVEHMEGKGTGLVATRALDTGDLIVAERPLMMAPILMPPGHDEFPDGLPPTVTKREVIGAQVRAGEKRYEELLARMTPARREAYLALFNCHEGDGCGPLTGRFRTNGIGAPGDYKFMDWPGEAGKFSFVADDISRANHSCRPNAHPHFDYELFATVLRAVRPIQAGEEICISYVRRGVDNYEERKKSLAPYGFECSCPSCVDHVASDARRAIIATFNNPEPVNRNPYYHIKRNLWKVSLIQEEGLEELTDYLSLHHHLRMGYRMMGDNVKAAEVRKREDQLNWVKFNKPALKELF